MMYLMRRRRTLGATPRSGSARKMVRRISVAMTVMGMLSVEGCDYDSIAEVLNDADKVGSVGAVEYVR